MARQLGLIAGLGRFPFEVARAARARGDRVHAAGIRDLTDAALAAEVDSLHWFHPGELQGFIDCFHAAGVRDAVMAGKVPRALLYRDPGALRPDALALRLLAGLQDRRDASLLGVFAEAVEQAGIRLHGQAALTPALQTPPGVLGARAPGAAQARDVAFALPIARRLAALDVGQCVAVKDGGVLALEAIEGTDEMLRRAAALGGPGVVAVKVARPAQDPRFDVPVVGAGTIETMISIRAAVLAVEAHRSVFLERERAVALADAAGIALVGLAAESRDGEREAAGAP